MTTIIFKNDVLYGKTSPYDKIIELINEFFGLVPPDVGLTEETLGSALTPGFVFKEISSVLEGKGGEVANFFATLIISILLVYICSIFTSSVSPLAEGAVTLIALFPAVRQTFFLIVEVGESLSEIATFFGSLLPLLLGIILMGGGAEGAVATSLQVSLVSSLVENVCSEVLMPVLYALLVMAPFSSLGSKGAERFGLSLRTFFTKGLGLAVAITSGIFALQSIIATSKDTAALRLARFTAQTISPSVGAVISGSISTLASGISYAKGVVGAGAIIVIVTILLSPLLALILYRICIELSCTFADMLGTKTASRALVAMKHVIDGSISLLLLSSALMILQLVLFIRGGASLI